MGIFDGLFKKRFPTSNNSDIRKSIKQLQAISSTYNERSGALTRLESFFLNSNDKNDQLAISHALLEIVLKNPSIEIRESSLNTLDSIIDKCIQFSKHPNLSTRARSGLSNIATDTASCLIKVIENDRDKNENELRRKSFWTLQKIAPLVFDDALLSIFMNGLNDKNENIRMAAIWAFENTSRLCDDSIKKHIAEIAIQPLCQALNDSGIWVGAARTLGYLGPYAIKAVDSLYSKLDDPDGNWAANSMRKITGADYGNKDKDGWRQWIQEHKT